MQKFYIPNPNLAQNGGRQIALNKLKNLYKFDTYEINRNTLSYTTTNLSAYLNFGCISIRETYFALKNTLNKISNEQYFEEQIRMSDRTPKF